MNRCDCEHSQCHPDGDCQKAATETHAFFGIKQWICAECYAKIKAIKVEKIA